MNIIYQSNDYVVVNKPPNVHIDRDYDFTVEKYV